MQVTQEKLEEKARTDGRQRYLRKYSYHARVGWESDTDYGKRLISRCTDKVHKLVWDGMLTTAPTVYAKKLEGADSHTVTVTTLRVLFDAISQKRKFTKAATMVAEAVEREIISQHVYNTNKAVWEYCHQIWNKNQDRATSNHRKWRDYIDKQITKGKVPEYIPWTKPELIQVGSFLIECVREATGFIRYEMIFTRNNRQYRAIAAEPELFEWIREYKEWRSHLFPMKYPMAIPPLPWVGIADGGYPPDLIRNKFVIAEKHGDFKAMPMPVRSVNAIQATRWRVNKQVLDVAKTLWERDILIGELPKRTDLEMPEPPKPVDELTMDELRDWKRKKGKTYELNQTLRSKRVRTFKIVHLADTLKDNKEFYFPHCCDFRGRTYAQPSFLNPQGGDLSRGLLEFAETKRVPKGMNNASKWLKNHGANCYGEEKGVFTQRCVWVEYNSDKIIKQANDPLTEKWWRDASDPFMFLAFCFAWKQYIEKGTTNLPCSVDASNNGLQILSLIAGDHYIANKTNAIPTLRPQDLYQEVANRVIDFMQEDESPFAPLWVRFGITRATVKRQVMTVPYGITMQNCRDRTDEWFYDKVNDGAADPFINDRWQALHYLSTVIWDSMSGLLNEQKKVMKWLRDVADSWLTAGNPVEWVTPCGFHVIQDYEQSESLRVCTKLNGKVTNIRYDQPNGKQKKNAHKNAIAANFVHSIDASCLHTAVNTCIDKGVSSFAMIHDSYGTHCTNMEKMINAARQAYHDHFQEDLLMRTINPEKMKAIPEKFTRGNCDLSHVKESLYLFS